MTPLRKDLAFQRYRASDGDVVAAYTLDENQFTILKDDAAAIMGRLLTGEDRSALLKEIQDQLGPSIQDDVSAFLDSVAPLFFDAEGTGDHCGPRKHTEHHAPMGLTEEDHFFGFCAQEGLFSAAAWELSYACNLRCVHCYNPHHKANHVLETEQWLDLLCQARELGLLRLSLTGGEVGLHPGFWRIMDKARSLHLAVDVLTNGLVFADAGIAQDLAALFPRSVQCSLYGSTPTTHEAITGVHGSWEQTMRCLQHFAALGVPLAIKCPAMRSNYREIPKVARIAEDVGAMLQVDVNVTARNDGSDAPTSLRLDEEQLSWLFQQPGLPIYQGLEKVQIDADLDPEDGVCGAGTNGLCVQPDGIVVPCLSFMLPLGQVPKQSLREVWHGDALSDWRKKKRRDRAGCEGCSVMTHCSFCPGIALSDTGHALNRNTNDCRIARVRASLYKQLHPFSK